MIVFPMDERLRPFLPAIHFIAAVAGGAFAGDFFAIGWTKEGVMFGAIAVWNGFVFVRLMRRRIA